MIQHNRRFVCFLFCVIAVLSLLLYVFQSLWVLIGMSSMLAYLLDPFVERGQAYIPRPVLAGGYILAVMAVALLTGITFLPAFYREIVDLLSRVPALVDLVTHTWIPTIKHMVETSRFFDGQDIDRLIEDMASLSQLSEKAISALSSIGKSFPQLIGTFFHISIIPFVTFFLLVQKEAIHQIFWSYIPKNLKTDMTVLLKKCDEALNLVIKGQVTIGLIDGLLYILGFSIIGVPSSFALGFLAGLCRLVPYMDLLVGGPFALMAVLSHFQTIGQVFWLGIVFIVIQSLDGMFITPKILGGKTGLHPMVVILSVMAFGSLFGFWGVILSVPLIALIKAFIQTLSPYYWNSKYFLGLKD